MFWASELYLSLYCALPAGIVGLVQARGLNLAIVWKKNGTFRRVRHGSGVPSVRCGRTCPCELDALALSHCHADHMGDIISLQVYRSGARPSALPAAIAETVRDAFAESRSDDERTG